MANAQPGSKGFFPALFDFSFTSFITLKFLKVIYAILVVAIGLTGLAMFVALASEGGGAVVAALFLAPLATLFYLIIARIYMELLALLFRIGENTSTIAHSLGAGSPSGPPSGYPSGPPSGYPSGPPSGYPSAPQ